MCLFLIFVKILSSLKKFFKSRLLLWGICLNAKSLWRQEADILYIDVAGRGQPGTIHLGFIFTGYVQVKLQYLIISRILYRLTYFSVKACCTVLQWGAFEDMSYMCTYSRSFNISQVMPNESVLLSGKTIQFVWIKILGISHIILMILAEVPLSVPARLGLHHHLV